MVFCFPAEEGTVNSMEQKSLLSIDTHEFHLGNGIDR